MQSAFVEHGLRQKCSEDTSTKSCFVFSFLARLLVLPMLLIALNVPNLAHQHWESKKTVTYMRIQFLPDGSLFVLIITNKVVINK